MRPANKRTTFYIKKNFQSRFILRFVAVTTAWAVATVMLFAYLAERRLEKFRFSSHIDITTTGELLLPITLGAHVVTMLGFAIFLLYTIHALWKSLAPPLYHIKSDIAGLTDGEMTRTISLRKSDIFNDLAADLDEMRRGLLGKIIGIKEQQLPLSEAAARLDEAVAGGRASQADVDALLATVERLKQSTGEFKS